jgi:hypothetical protein
MALKRDCFATMTVERICETWLADAIRKARGSDAQPEQLAKEFFRIAERARVPIEHATTWILLQPDAAAVTQERFARWAAAYQALHEHGANATNLDELARAFTPR